MDWPRVIRQDVVPVGSAYVLLLAVFGWYLWRRKKAGRRSTLRISARPGWRALVTSIVRTLAGGYVFFALVILIFYLALLGEPGSFVVQSLAQGAILAFGVVLPAFVLLSWIQAVWRGRASGR